MKRIALALVTLSMIFGTPFLAQLSAAPGKCGLSAETHMCGGTCPPGSACQSISVGRCLCQPMQPTCSYDRKIKACGGSCPPHQECRNVLDRGCSCVV